jgi:hypothetical protein
MNKILLFVLTLSFTGSCSFIETSRKVASEDVISEEELSFDEYKRMYKEEIEAWYKDALHRKYNQEMEGIKRKKI